MRRFLMMMFLSLCLGMMMVTRSFAATQVDSLIKKLVDKGILTQKEGLDLKGEIAADEKVAREEGLKESLPKWVQNTTLKGDLRVRYQYERKKADTDSRETGRIRYRLGVESKVNDKVTVGAGLASGADNPRSTNQTFQDTFERGDVRLDYAYGEYKHSPQVSVIAGAFRKDNYLWAPTDLLWDTDINPMGGALHLEQPFDNTKVFLNSGLWVMDESVANQQTDPFIAYAQAGIDWKDKAEGEKFSAKAAGTYYGFNGVKGINLDWGSGTNTGRTSCSSSTGACTGAPIYDFDSIGASAEFGVRELLGGLPLRIDDYIALFGDYIYNLDPDNLNTGWAAGVKFGHRKVVSGGQWQSRYQYSYLGKDAWYDSFPDADRYSGQTDVYGHKVALEYGLTKNVNLGVNYYQDQKIKAAKNHNQILQADVLFKF